MLKAENRITNREQLEQILKNERKAYLGREQIRLEDKYRKSLKYEIYRYIAQLRKYEYLCYRRDHCKSNIFSKFWSLRVKICDRKKNQLGAILGIEITPNFMGNSVRICHQNVIINGIVGDNCVLHGHNVIGNKKTGAKQEVPKIGRNVDVGVGAILIGDIEIADGCMIGAGSVVTKSFLTPGTVIAGVPAREISPKKD